MTSAPKLIECPRAYFGLKVGSQTVNVQGQYSVDLRIPRQIDKGTNKGRAVGNRNNDAYCHGPHVVRCEIVGNPALYVVSGVSSQCHILEECVP